MAKRTMPQDDPARTDLLAIDELFVLKGSGDETHYHTWLQEDEPECCPRCGGTKLKKQNLFSRSYYDCIMDGSTPRIITLVYSFYKFRCLDSGCRHVFQQEISFATVNDNVTHRLENRIATMVIAGASYGSVASFFQNELSRQAVGQIFNRWVWYRNEQRSMKEAPAVAAIVTGRTDKSEYTLLLSCDDGIRILDALYGIDSDRMIASVRRFCGGKTTCVLTDCNATVYAAVKEALPRATHIIPAEMWLKLVRGDFTEYARPYLRWVNVPNKQQLLLEAKAADEDNMSYELKRIFDARDNNRLLDPYKDYHYLRSLIMDREFRWHIEELDEWPDSIDNAFKAQLDITLLTYHEYRSEIAAQQEHWDSVPINLLSATDRLEELIHARRTFSEEALQAAVLYSTGADPANWQGVEIGEAINKLSRLQQSSRRNDYDQ